MNKKKNIKELRAYRGKSGKRNNYISFMLPRVIRTSIDIDGKNQFVMLKIYFNCFMFSNNVLIFETKKGYHVQMEGIFTSEQKILIRSILGDDIDRIDSDEERLSCGYNDEVDTLFNKKRRYGVWGYEDLIKPLSEPFWDVRNK